MKLVYIYLILPFVFALILSLFAKLKNSIYIKKVSNWLFSTEFILSAVGIFCFKNIQFNIFGFDFNIDKFTLYFAFLTSFLFLMFSIFSKSFIRNLYKLFYSMLFLLFGIVNLALFSDNIFLFLLIILWFILINYFLISTFSKKENKLLALKQLLCDLFWYILAISLIVKDFIRYFIVNDISFTFSNLVQNLYQIEDTTIFVALIGFLILIGQLFNFIPFNSKRFSLIKKSNSFVMSLFGVNSIILGSFLFSKVYLNFNYLIYQIQEFLVIYLLINLIYFTILSFRQDRLSKFLFVVFIANIIIGIFPIFTFEQESFYSFSYYMFVLIISFAFCSFIFMVIQNKMHCDKIADFKKIQDKTKLIPLFLFIALLNLISVPFLAFFSAKLITFMMMFSVDYGEFILNLSSYIVLFSAFLLSLAVFNFIYKILIEPSENMNKYISLSKHQVVIMIIFVVTIILLGFCPQYMFNQFDTILNIGNF